MKKSSKYVLPKPIPGKGDAWTMLQACKNWLALIALPSVIGYVWQGLKHGVWGLSLVGVVTSLGFGTVLVHGLKAGYTECNSKVYWRDKQPVRYWLVSVAWCVAYVWSTSTLFWFE